MRIVQGKTSVTVQVNASTHPPVRPVLTQKTSRTITKRLSAVLDSMEQGRPYSQTELAEVAGVSYRSLRRYIDQLVRLQLVTLTGRTSATRITKV